MPAAADPLELYARLAIVLRLGAPWPLPVWAEPEDPEVIGAIRALRKRANRGEMVEVGREELAFAVAMFLERPEPRVQESADLLVELILGFQATGWMGDPTQPGRPLIYPPYELAPISATAVGSGAVPNMRSPTGEVTPNQ